MVEVVRAVIEEARLEPTIDVEQEAERRLDDLRLSAPRRVINATGRLLNVLANRAAFDEGLLVLSLMEGHLRNPAAWGELTRWFYLKWAEWHWQREAWAEVVAVHLEYLAGGGSTDAELMRGAFNNWLLALTAAADSGGAEQALEQCRQHFASAVCEPAQTVWRAHLKSGASRGR